MRLVAWLMYGAALAVLGVAIVFTIEYADVYGFDLGGTLQALPVVVVLAGIPAWIGSLAHRAARQREVSP